MIDTKDIWSMKYSGSSLKILRISNGKKTVFIDLTIKPDIIILKEMNTLFDGKSFRIYRLRKPQKRQLDKIINLVKQYEKIYNEVALQIDALPSIGGQFNGVDIDLLFKNSRKNTLKPRIEQEMSFGFNQKLNWDWHYYQFVLEKVLADSPVFTRINDIPNNLPDNFKHMYQVIEAMKAKYRDDFQELRDTVVEYNGRHLMGNIVI